MTARDLLIASRCCLTDLRDVRLCGAGGCGGERQDAAGLEDVAQHRSQAVVGGTERVTPLAHTVSLVHTDLRSTQLGHVLARKERNRGTLSRALCSICLAAY